MERLAGGADTAANPTAFSALKRPSPLSVKNFDPANPARGLPNRSRYSISPFCCAMF